MAEQLFHDVDRYIGEHFVGHDEALEACLADSAAAGLPPIAVSPAQGKFLYLLAKSIKATSILEIGTLGGYSTIWLARALPPDGRLVSLELEPKHAEVARKNIERAGLADKVTIRVGKATDLVPQLVSEGDGAYSLVFIDADKVNYPTYFEWSMDLTVAGSVIEADNVVRDGAVIDPDSTDPNVVAMRRFHETVARERNVEATVIQTVGLKGYDGFTIAYCLK